MAGLDREAHSQLTLGGPGIAARPEVRGQSMKRFQKGGARGDRNRAVKVQSVTSAFLTRRNENHSQKTGVAIIPLLPP